jgi:2Fe-2S ferredoxin
VPNVIYVLPGGERRRVEVPAGMSVMQGAIRHNIRGIDAECGGCLSCATCHVYVDEAWAERVGTPDSMELELLDEVACERRPTSRLSCQIIVTPAHDGLSVQLPERQS